MMGLFLSILPFLPQESEKQTDSPIVRELEEKIKKADSVSFTVRLHTLDPKGAKLLRHEMNVYLHFSKGDAFMRRQEIRPDEAAHRTCMLYERHEDLLMWSDSTAGQRTKLRPMWLFMNGLNDDLGRLLRPGEKALAFDDRLAASTSSFFIDIDPDASGQAAQFRFAMSWASRLGISWLNALANTRKEDRVEGDGEITLTHRDKGKTTVIDRKTGILRSIRLDFKGGGGRLLTVSDVALGVARPGFKAPEVVRETRMWPEDMPTTLPDAYYGQLAGMFRSVLQEWERLRVPEKADAVREFLTTLGARHDSASRFAAGRGWANSLLDDLRRKGEALPKPEGDLEALAKRVKDYVLKGEEMHAERFEERRVEFADRLRDMISETDAPAEARADLSRRLAEALRSERLDAARAKHPGPDWEEVLPHLLEN